MVAIPASQTDQHIQRIGDRSRATMPAHHAGEAAVIESVLRAGHRVQVDKNLEPGPLGPVERSVQILGTARVTGHIPEHEIRHWNTHQIAAMCGNVPKIGLGNIRVAMPRQQSLQLSRLRSPMQPDLVRLAAGGKIPGFIHRSSTSQLPRFTPLIRSPTPSAPDAIPVTLIVQCFTVASDQPLICTLKFGDVINDDGIYKTPGAFLIVDMSRIIAIAQHTQPQRFVHEIVILESGFEHISRRTGSGNRVSS